MKPTPFLTIITWTYKRPTLLRNQLASLAAQTCQEFEQVLTQDTKGIGIPGVHQVLQTTDCWTDYIWIFDDDDIIIDPTFIEKVKAVVEKEDPDVIFVKSQHTPTLVMPDKWPIEFAHISNINYIVKREIWMKYRSKYTAQSGGDGHFILAVMQEQPLKVAKLEGVMLATQRISKGKPEDETDEHEQLGEYVVIQETCSGKSGSFYKDQEIQITPQNRADVAELIRCRRAIYRDRPFRPGADKGSGA